MTLRSTASPWSAGVHLGRSDLSHMNLKDLLAMTVLAAIWGASFLFLRVASPALGPLVVAAGRVGLAAALLWPLALRAGHGPTLWRHRWALRAASLLSCVLPFLALSRSALTLPAGLMSILNAATPMWGALVGWAWDRESLTGSRLLGLGIDLTTATRVAPTGNGIGQTSSRA